ncbi:MAG: zinc-ribbon domain-containing protein [Lachnospiraceae bacterium]|nr:zinc-ribbon domain-containing protein [Lachnospiraceae bacterium]
MYCSTCGTKLDDKAQFCYNCGTKVAVQIVEETQPEAAPASNPVTEEVKAEATVQPIVEEVKTEAPVQPVAEEVKTEAPVEPVVEEIKTAAPVEPVVEEVKTEAPVQPVVEEVKTETPVQPVVDEVKAEAPVQHVVEEVKTEAPAQPVVEEVKTETPVQPAAQTVNVVPVQNIVNASTVPVQPAANAAPAQPVANAAPAQNTANATAATATAAKGEKPKKKGKGCLIAILIFVVLSIAFVLLVVAIFVIAFLLNKPAQKDYSNSSDYYGNYSGTSTVVNTYGSEDLAFYLASKGIQVDVNELLTDQLERDFAIALYNDANTTPAAWDMAVYMGEFFGYQKFHNKNFITYENFDKGISHYGDGDLLIDNPQNEFHLYVLDEDKEGKMAEHLFGINDTDGKYEITMDGTIDGDCITGTMIIKLQYGDMPGVFKEDIEFKAYR